MCATCHGQGLKGLGNVPPLAGRSPTYTVRQLYDFQSGARAGLIERADEGERRETDHRGHGVDCRLCGFAQSMNSAGFRTACGSDQ